MLLARRAYLAVDGMFSSIGRVVAIDGDDPDPNYDYYDDQREFQCYVNLPTDQDPAFPFHVCCLDLLKLRLGRTGHLSEEDKDVLYEVMRGLSESTVLRLDYGGSKARDWQEWESRGGDEVLVADPSPLKGFDGRIRALVVGGYFKPSQSSASSDLGTRVRSDPFKPLPFDIFVAIAEHLDPDSLMNLAKASWFVNLFAAGATDSFWKKMIRLQMVWFFELLAYMDTPESFRGASMKAVYLWAACGSRAMPNMRGGDLMRVANRRRIWRPCGQLVQECQRRLRANELEQDGESPFQKLLRTSSSCTNMPVVTHDAFETMHGEVQTRFWIREWEDTYAKEQLVEAFWHHESGFLTGVAVTSVGDNRQIVGFCDKPPLLGCQRAIIPVDDWVCGLILHISSGEDPLRPFEPTIMSPKGLTVSRQVKQEVMRTKALKSKPQILCKSGLKLHLGEASHGHPKKVLVSRPGWQVVGLMCQLGVCIKLP
jgi:hypothetical protein